MATNEHLPKRKDPTFSDLQALLKMPIIGFLRLFFYISIIPNFLNSIIQNYKNV